jgi:uncharacterized protein GlcG (DUF336 family)
MSRQHFESLEKRQLFSGGQVAQEAVEHASREPRSAAVKIQPPSAKANLTVAEVTTILGQAASQARPGQVIVVMDDEGVTLGIVAMAGSDDNVAPDGTPYPFMLDPDGAGPAAAAPVARLTEREQLIRAASARARTAAFFQSNENAFTTRTARFIIQDHFPHPVRNTPGGPLYGVQFSSFRGSDTLRDEQSGFPALSGDPGGIPIYKNGIKAGGIGVAGDGRDIAARRELLPISLPGHNKDNRAFNGREESDFDEAVAMAGVKGFEAPPRIRATKIFVDGLRFPYTKNRPARGQATRSLATITAANQAALVGSEFLEKPDAPVRASTAPPFVRATFGGVEGFLKRQFEVNAAGVKVPVANNLAAQIVDSNDTAANGTLLASNQRLLEADVNQILNNAAATAFNTRALIREPDGVEARVHIAVVDRDGDLLGVFRMDDGPNFGYDVAIQKARTAAFFSDDNHAITTRALGFLSQQFFPIGINQNSPVTGPFFEVQDRLFLTGIAQGAEPSSVNFRPLVGPNNDVRNPLRNGITIFPGGIPLYKNGVLVGAVGISGDGVDQDERIGYAGAGGYRPAEDQRIRADQLNDNDAIDFLTGRVQRLVDLYDLTADAPTLLRVFGPSLFDERIDLTDETLLPERFRERFREGFTDFRLPYIRLPRNPERFDPDDIL